MMANVTQKHLVETRRLAHDETPFLSAMQLRVITLVWRLGDGNVIPLDIHGRDRSARDEASYPSINLLSILYHIVGSPLLKYKRFIAFLGDPWVKHLEGLNKAFIFYPTSTPLGLQLLLPIEQGTTPSWVNTPQNAKR
jgi:hypothetical protein